jgi:ATP-dependent helicase/nuclease subunit A
MIASSTFTIADELERTQALDPHQSFIVQAPAGSGKTELLTQRFLMLLSLVNQPEEILAITFTKKSAAEMRARIIAALQAAHNQTIVTAAHGLKTRELANKVLNQDKKFAWQLLANPNQLRIQTIDSFNASLTKQLPMLAKFGAAPDITDDPYYFYRSAIAELLAQLEENHEWSDSIATLLLHLDNDLNKVEALLTNLLAKRDQWLPYVTLTADPVELRYVLEKSLTTIVKDAVMAVANAFPQELAHELLILVRYAAQNIAFEKPDSPLTALIDLPQLPGKTANDTNSWLMLTELLMTKTNEWRKKIDKTTGFYPATNFKNAAEKSLATDMKQRMQLLLNKLTENNKLKYAFIELRLAPAAHYADAQWETLAALSQVLRIAVAQLQLTFQQYGKIDYIENSLAALVALGPDHAPTDITLALDYQIKHILVDEFQDTSNNQYRLLEKITAGWEPYDGRTLFLVGDPMQSIYRFREAEVGLFIRTREFGLGHIELMPLTLSVNFRSSAEIVNWLNQSFSKIFPQHDEIMTGAVSYSPSSANALPNPDQDIAIGIHHFPPNANSSQAEKIVALIEDKKLIDPNGSIAILVRSRSHLIDVIPALKKANLTYRAIDIDPLTARPFIQDVMALTRALLHTADKVAWLAILRAPWCGLTLADLWLLVGKDHKKTLWENLQKNILIKSLSPEGQQRLARVLPVLTAKMQERRRYTLRYWVESTWLLLGGPACLNQESDLEDIEAYFKLLQKIDKGGDVIHFDALNEAVQKLYATSNKQARDNLQIMTIHNAKGLEFDTVILPHLEKKSSVDDKQLLLWMEQARADSASSLLLAPIHATGDDTDTIYEYIKRQQNKKNSYEVSRLLYVAATRAKKSLHLLFDAKYSKNSLLEKLMQALPAHIVQEIQAPSYEDMIKDENTDGEPSFALNNILHRIPCDWLNPISEHSLPNSGAYHRGQNGFQIPNKQPRLVGTFIHQLLQQMAEFGTQWWTEKPHDLQVHYLQRHLRQLGLPISAMDAAITQINMALTNTLADPRGQWILQAHTDSKTEWQLTTVKNQQAHAIIIDRTFVSDENIRWIIDYKTTEFSGDNLAEFLVTAKNKHQDQLQDYYAALKNIDDRVIRLGLYFPLVQGWYEWDLE